VTKTQETEKEELYISEEFAGEIEKYAKLEGLSPQEFIKQVVKDRFEKLKQIYPDKPLSIKKNKN
jgi:hypothetical protein